MNRRVAAAARRGRARGARDLGRQLVLLARDGRRLGDLHASRRGADDNARPSLRLRDVPGRTDGGRRSSARQMFAVIAAEMEANRDEFCRLDGVIGDADHGIAMALGFAAARNAVAAMDASAEPTALLNAAAKAFLSAVGASCGPLYATALMRAGAAVKGKASLDDADVVAWCRRWRRHPGPRQGRARGQDDARRLGARGAGGGRREDRRHGAGGMPGRAAAAAARRRRGYPRMVAAKGRAERLGERARGHIDPGAASAAVVVAAMCRRSARDAHAFAYFASTSLIALTLAAERPASSKSWARNASAIDLASSVPMTRAPMVMMCALFDSAARSAE